MRSRRTRCVRDLVCTVPALAGLFGCSGGDAPKAWNELSTCLAGSAISADLPKRIEAVRRIQLNADEAKPGAQGWPARCAPAANALTDAVASATEFVLLKRVLATRLNCAEGKASCAFPADASLVSITTELWDAAKAGSLTATSAANVKAPVPAPAPLLAAADFKSFSKEPRLVVGPVFANDGHARLLLKATSGKGRPTVCELTPALDAVHCVDASSAMPEVQLHTVQWARAPEGLYAAALTESGQVAYDLKTGAQSDVKGVEGDLVADGLAVEQKAEKEEKADKPGKAGKADKADKAESAGYQAFVLAHGKATKPVDLTLPDKVRPSVVVGRVMWLDEGNLVIQGVAGGRLREEARLPGPFAGQFHSCAQGSITAVATWERHVGQHGAKPAEKSSFAITLLRDGKWSAPHTATLPVARMVDSELICTATGASLAWAAQAGDALEVSRMDCTADACKTQSAKLEGVHTNWAWAAAPVGDKTIVAWRGAAGETRLRAAALAALPEAKDTIVFDSSDYGGPETPDGDFIAGPDAVLLLFKGDNPVALRLGSDSSARVLGGG